MNRIHTLVFVILLLWTPDRLLAGVSERDWKTPGDGLLTYDDENQREWLDLTQTQLFQFPGTTLEDRYQAVLAETIPGGMFHGFTPAVANDALALAQSAGIDTTTLDFDTNQAAANLLIDVVAPTLVSGNNRAADGFVSDRDRDRRAIEIVFGPGGRIGPFAGFQETSFTAAQNGVWLYREVPEPATCALIASVVITLFFLRRNLR